MKKMALPLIFYSLMAENLNYSVNGSTCYENKPANCDKYGRLYDWDILSGWMEFA
jgi:uncharacterized protein (TIGR02145 family)